MLQEIELFYNQILVELKDLQAKRSYSERTIFDKSGKRMRRNLEKGYHKGLRDGIKIVHRRYKRFIKTLLSEASDE